MGISRAFNVWEIREVSESDEKLENNVMLEEGKDDKIVWREERMVFLMLHFPMYYGTQEWRAQILHTKLSSRTKSMLFVRGGMLRKDNATRKHAKKRIY